MSVNWIVSKIDGSPGVEKKLARGGGVRSSLNWNSPPDNDLYVVGGPGDGVERRAADRAGLLVQGGQRVTGVDDREVEESIPAGRRGDGLGGGRGEFEPDGR